MKWYFQFLKHRLLSTLWLFVTAMSLLLIGCETKEKVIDVDTPAGGVEVEKSEDGSYEIEIERKKNSDNEPGKNEEPDGK